VQSQQSQGFIIKGYNPSPNLGFTAFVLGDFNQDGITDLVAVGQGTLQVFLGKGDGTFAPGFVYAAGNDAISIVTADFNNDGIADLALLEQVATVRILIGKGDGSFRSAAIYPTGGTQLAAADFNVDGNVDLVVMNPLLGGTAITVLPGQGDGTFGTPLPQSLDTQPNMLAVADLNGDNIPDLITAYGQNSFRILLGRGDGTFAVTPLTVPLDPAEKNYADSVATGDFNNDGIPDIAIGKGSGVTVLLGNGDGTFDRPSFFPITAGVNSVKVVDVNGDGLDDIITSNISSNSSKVGSFSVLLGDGTGSLHASSYYDGYSSGGRLLAGDFNGDGRVDILEPLGATIFVFLGLPPVDLNISVTRAPNFRQSQTGALYRITVANAGPAATQGQVVVQAQWPKDFVAQRAEGTGWNCSAFNGTAACTRNDSLSPGAQYPEISVSGDLSARAGPNLVSNISVSIEGMSDWNPANDTVVDNTTVLQFQTILFGTLVDRLRTALPFTISVTATSGLPVAITASGACSINGFLLTLQATGECRVTASQAGNSLYLPAPDVTRSFLVANDPTTVTLTVTPASALVGTPITLSAGTFPAVTGTVTFYDGVLVLGTAPVAGGVATITTRLNSAGTRSFRAYYTGAPTYLSASSITVHYSVRSLPGFAFKDSKNPISQANVSVIGDFDGDGILDIAGALTSRIVVNRGDGKGGYGVNIVSNEPAPFLTPNHIAVGDFDGDGKLDLAIAAASPFNTKNPQHAILIRFGNGDGTFLPSIRYSVNDGALAVADFNGDGIADLAVAQEATGGVVILASRRDRTFEDAAEYSVAGAASQIAIAAADMNVDGKADLVAVFSDPATTDVANHATVLFNRGDGTFSPATVPVTDSVQAVSPLGLLALGDLNGDGTPDLVVQNGFNYRDYRCSVTVYLGRPDGTLRSPTRYLCSNTVLAGPQYQVSSVGSPAGVVIVDFDNDGKADVAAMFSFNTGYLQLFRGNGDGTLLAPSVTAFNSVGQPTGLIAADLNGDGKVDLFASGMGSTYTLTAVQAPALSLGLEVNSGMTIISVANRPNADPTAGVVSVVFTPTDDIRIVSIGGSGWKCDSACTRSDVLPGGGTYPPITIVTSKLWTSPNPSIQRVTVFGGGAAPVEGVKISL